jgi:hypothetical protein
MHPGHDRELVERFILTWREEFGIIDSNDHIEFGEPLDAAGATMITAKSSEGRILLERLTAAGILSDMQ